MRDRKIRRWVTILFILTAILISVSVISLCIGAAGISLRRIPHIMWEGKGTGEYSILFDIRLPRIILGFAIGGALSLAGTILQGIFRNPLVEPYTLGISGGASLGVCLNIAFKWYDTVGIIAYPISGFLGAALVIVFVYSLSMKTGTLKTQGILLTGVMISFISSSLVMLIMALSRSEDLHGIVFWIMGSLDEPNMLLIRMAVIGALAGLILSYFSASISMHLPWGRKRQFTSASMWKKPTNTFHPRIVSHRPECLSGRNHRICWTYHPTSHAHVYRDGPSYSSYQFVLSRGILFNPLRYPCPYSYRAL